MRTLSPELLLAQRAASAVPYVRVRIGERIAGVARLRWERLHNGMEPDSYHAAVVAGDGSLVRVRYVPEDGQLYWQRTPAPGPSTNFSSWGALTSAAAAGVALAASGSEVLLCYVASGGGSVVCRQSTDYGATFGPPQTVAVAAASWLAAACNAAGDAVVLYSVGAAVYAVRRTGGVWGAAAQWPHVVGSISGLAVTSSVDYQVAVCGTTAAGAPRVWSCVYGDGGTRPPGVWGPLSEVAVAESDSAVAFRTPSIGVVGVTRLLFVQTFGGSQPYSRPFWTHVPAGLSFEAGVWREPVPFDLACQFGPALAPAAGAAWLSTPGGVWLADSATSWLDVSADVLELTMDQEETSGRVRLRLRNDDGRYSDLSGERAVIRGGSQIEVAPGYVTQAGPAYSAGPQFWIERWEYHSGGGRAVFVLEAVDGWALLASWRAGRQFVWAAGETPVANILTALVGRAGLALTNTGGSGALASLRPAFTVHPGEDGRTAVQRLLETVPDVLAMTGAAPVVFEPLADAAAVYEFGVAHPIREMMVRQRTPAANYVGVFGQNVSVEQFDWDSLSDVYDRRLQVFDRNLTTDVAAADRASFQLRKAAIAARSDDLVAPPNCGQELHDVVEVTDAAAGLMAARRRVRGISLRYRRAGRPLYEMRVRLGDP